MPSRIKEKVKKWEQSQSIILKIVYYSVRYVWRFCYILFDNESRSHLQTRFLYRKFYYQRSTFTAPNRYPNLFKACTAYLQNIEQPQVLSFGCSTGDEVFSLGEYIPKAVITGVDINRWCLRQCRKKDKSSRYLFIHRFSKQFEEASEFDAIFCLAVFQRTENRTNKNNTTAKGLLFEQFEKEIAMLDTKLKHGGILAIDHSDFAFTDTTTAKRYNALPFENNQTIRNRPLFDRNNQKTADSHSSFRLFIKI
ncbi:class I SAM-dependent methyltransferase [Paludibacter sp.]|uniref:class I SAM-dependent methyltransferase n=1 Tax=Paludibacter sp. TaxID=1898105 RepID=UPI001355B589|nr:class I SAM-dependent methyltransferase [Paludibacter sp.]MTK54529.1 class I SAM-dependent methyltransferase [Paludibacter sp.]